MFQDHMSDLTSAIIAGAEFLPKTTLINRGPCHLTLTANWQVGPTTFFGGAV